MIGTGEPVGNAPAFVDCYGELANRLTPRVLEICPGVEVFRSRPRSEAELIARLRGRQHVIVYMGYLSAPVLCACPDLKTVAYLSSGLATHVDLDTARSLGITIRGVRNYGDQAVAEHAVALAFAALKRIAESDRRVRQNRWELVRTDEFAGRTFGVIGLGGIGRQVARTAAALGANVFGWSRSARKGERTFDDGVVTTCSLDTVLSRADILSLHLALTPETEGILGAKEFARIKPGAILVNTARAALVDEIALVDALRCGRLSHCALDVFHKEPPDPASPLLALENVTLTPHSAWYTGDAIDRLLISGFKLLKQQIGEFSRTTD
ncbi:MAG: NAD(P)-binding domain-containing protein [Paracoccaceae bacterium]|nr:NAD(P)-binding domain-containing protein [Paracoccaceae bacterium]